MYSIVKLLMVSIIGISSLQCSSLEKKKASLNNVTIMTYNVETLFDSKDDHNKNDQTYLPITKKQSPSHKEHCQKAKFPKWIEECLKWDWNDEVVNIKLQRIAEVIRKSNPDILLLQEIENKYILEKLNSDFNLGYKEIVLIEGGDDRGIDTAILSKLELADDPVLHYVPYKNFSKEQRQDSRGILEASFRLPGLSLITVYSLHLPAPFHPYEMRVEALEYLNILVKDLPKDRIVVAGGDFNIPIEEDNNYQLVEKSLRPSWLVAHKEGCSNCKGTTYYPKNKTWSFLDFLMISKSINNHKKWKFDKQSIQIVNQVPEQLDNEGFPKSFDPITKTGVSDHLPIMFRITGD